MFAPPKRYGRPARSNRGPARVTNGSESCRLLPAASGAARRAPAARAHAVSETTRIRASSGTVRSRGREDSSSRRRATAALVLAVAILSAAGAGATTAHAAGVAFTDRGAERLVVTASAYRLTLSKK